MLDEYKESRTHALVVVKSTKNTEVDFFDYLILSIFVFVDFNNHVTVGPPAWK